MKKVLLVLALFGLLSVGTSVYAANVDGAWASLTPEAPFFAMAKENGDNVLITILDFFGEQMAAWAPLYGPFNGTTGNLSLILSSEANGNLPQSLTGVFTMTSLVTASFLVTSCTNFPQQNNCAPVGTVIKFIKIF